MEGEIPASPAVVSEEKGGAVQDEKMEDVSAEVVQKELRATRETVEEKEAGAKRPAPEGSEVDQQRALVSAALDACAAGSPSDHKQVDIAVNGEPLKFKVAFKKSVWEFELGSENTVGELKSKLEPLSMVPKSGQKLTFKSLLKDDSTLSAAGIKNGTKIMLVGSAVTDVLSVALAKATAEASQAAGAAAAPEIVAALLSLSEQEPHKKIIAKGKPENAVPGYRGRMAPLPPHPVQGIVNRRGDVVQVSVKLDKEEVWLGSKSSTDKIQVATIARAVSEPIKNHEDYHIVTLQLGKFESSKLYLYWFPAQFVTAFFRAIGF